MRPRVLLVNVPKVQPEDLEDADLVIAQPATPLPGLTPGEAVQGDCVPQVESTSGFAWPAFVSLKNVHVRTRRQVVMEADWRVIATASGMPWIAVREMPREQGGGGARRCGCGWRRRR